MSELDPELAELCAAYREALSTTLADLEPWWTKLRELHSAKALRQRWPCGLAGHPRVLGVYLEHYRIVSAAIDGRGGQSARTPHFMDEEAWGIEAEPEPETLIPMEAHRLLVDRLQVEAPELYAVMIYLLLPPLGREPQPSPNIRDLAMVREGLGYRPARFLVETIHGVDRGVERLLAAPGDLPTSERAGERGAVVPTACSEVHAMAHGAYRRALESALGEAESWWRVQLSEAEGRGCDAEQARVQCFDRHLSGPAAYPGIVGVVRAYWRLCEEANAMLPAEQAVAPADFLLGWIDDEAHETWVQVLSAMPYWPLTRDSHGAWIS